MKHLTIILPLLIACSTASWAQEEAEERARRRERGGQGPEEHCEAEGRLVESHEVALR